jgi:C-terminal processing protease CtpA/Prc
MAAAHEGRGAVAGHDHDPAIVHVRSHGRARLGIGVIEMTPELRRFFGAPRDVGLLVSQVEADSPAKAGGIKVGDVVIAVAGDEVDDAADVHAALAERDDGEKVDVVVMRNKKKLRKKVKVEAREHAMPEVIAPPAPPDPPFVPGAKSKLLEKELERTRKQLREIEKRLDKLEQKRKSKDD